MLAAAAVSVALVVLWLRHAERYPTCREEVRMADGRVVTIVQRREYFRDYGTARSWVTLSLPEVGGVQTWESELAPIRIDANKGDIYAIGSPRGIKQFVHYQAPRHYLVAFKWSGNSFIRIPLLDVPEALRQEENVYPCVPEDRRHVVTLAAKDSHWCAPTGDRWKFGRSIKLPDYEALASFYAGLNNIEPQSE
jgi:hypothetical protein